MFTNYCPQKFSDLVFEDVEVRQRLQKYADGYKIKSLLLYGPPGTAKSLTARLLAKEAMKVSSTKRMFKSNAVTVINADDWNKKISEATIVHTWGHLSPYVVIDEVDELEKQQKALTKLIDQWGHLGGFILTTNKNPNQLLDRLVSRCDVIRISGLSEKTVLPIVRYIFDNEGIGVYYCDNTIRSLVESICINGLCTWRQIEDLVDDEVSYWLNN